VTWAGGAGETCARSAGYTAYRPYGAPAKLPAVVRHPQAIGAFVRRLFLALLPLVIAGDAGAQIIRPGMRFGEPSAWVSFGVALVSGFGVADGTTNSIHAATAIIAGRSERGMWCPRWVQGLDRADPWRTDDAT